MQSHWNDHTLEVKGNWTGRWLFLAPEYELHLDGECVDRLGGPRVHPTLEVVVEKDDGTQHHVEADLVSVLGYRPRCTLRVDGQTLQNERVEVDNFLNPFLMLVILVSTAVMLYVGPEVLQNVLPFV